MHECLQGSFDRPYTRDSPLTQFREELLRKSDQESVGLINGDFLRKSDSEGVGGQNSFIHRGEAQSHQLKLLESWVHFRH